MDRKSLFYIGGGVLLILSAVLSFFQSAIMSYGGWYIFGDDSFFRVLRNLKGSGYFKYYMREMTPLEWIRFVIPILLGLILAAKAFVGDMVPDIVLAGLFGVLALFAGIAFLKSFLAIFDGGKFKVQFMTVSMNLLMLLAYGGMAAIIFMKDSFGSFFFVPAAAAGGKALLRLVLYRTVSSRKEAYLMGLTYMPFKISLLFFLVEMVLAGALILIAMAVVED